MDGNIKQKREPNPGQNAKILSKITFFFAFSIFRRTTHQNFKDDDVYAPMNEFCSKSLGDRLEAEWNIERKNNNPSIITAIYRAFRQEYIFWGILSFLTVISLMIAEPILIGKLVAYFSPNQSKITIEYAFIYAVMLIGCIFSNNIFFHTYMFVMKLLAMKIKIACTTLIYRKILKLGTHQVTNAITGQAITLITKDVIIFEQVLRKFHQLLTGLVQIMVMAVMIYIQIGVAAFVGLSLIIFIIAIQAFFGHKTMKYRLATAQKTDERIQLTQEILSAIRIIKMYTLELFFSKSIDKSRRAEIRNFQILTYLTTVGICFGLLSRKLALYSCVITFVALGNHVTAEKAFVVTGCFSQLRMVLQIFIPICFLKIAELKAMVVRANNFLLHEEVSHSNVVKQIKEKQVGVTLQNVTVNYDNQSILQNINALFQPGTTFVLGGIGCGKSTLLRAILGDVTITGTIYVPGKASYASQEPWLFPGTIRQNIIFNEAFDKSRYDKVVHACALQKDLDMFSFGDQTILSDKGLNLSQGQKTRINLARAVYKQADVYLLDDCLSSVDLKVARHIFIECIKGFLKEKVCVLVSHSCNFLSNDDKILLICKEGVKFQGTYLELIETKPDILTESQVISNFDNQNDKDCSEENDKVEEASVQSDKKENLVQSTKNIYEENNEQGSVKKDVYYKYIASGGVKIFIIVIVLLILKQAMETWSDYFIRFWVDSEEQLLKLNQEYSTDSPQYMEAQQMHNNIMNQYSIVIFVSAVLVFLSVFLFFVFAGRASVNIHRQIINKILYADMSFFDKNYAGNIINRFSRDFSILDEQLPFPIFQCFRVFLSMTSVLIVISMVNPWFLIPSACLALILYFARCIYLPAGRNIRRIEGSTRSPVIGHMQATFAGLTTIKAAEAEMKVNDEFEHYQDVYNSTQYMHNATVEAFSFYMDVLTTIYIAIIILSILFLEKDVGAGNVGLAITQSLSLTGLLQWGVLQWSELEIQMTSVERILEYLHIKSEDKSGEALDDWPKNGKLVYKDVTLHYLQNSKPVLNNINFTIEPGMKIGIVGRTGAGKSSIVSTLFRLYEFEGTVSIDSTDIKTVKLDSLRSKISIMPQEPILFTGSIRSNLDPKSVHTDNQLWTALEKVEMKHIVKSLNLTVKQNSSAFSMGQKQLLCLARIILQNNTILVFDEATANVDATTDALIQRTITETFVNRSVIVIAHRLHTVLECDRVLVMNGGNAVEYDHPTNLLKNKDSMFYSMVKGSGLLK